MQRCYHTRGQTRHPYCFKRKERCKTVSPNGEITSRMRRNNDVSGDRRALMRRYTSKHQSYICRREASRYCATGCSKGREYCFGFLFQMWALMASKMVKSVLIFNFRSIYEVVRRNIMIATVSHAMMGPDMLHFVRGFSVQF